MTRPRDRKTRTQPCERRRAMTMMYIAGEWTTAVPGGRRQEPVRRRGRRRRPGRGRRGRRACRRRGGRGRARDATAVGVGALRDPAPRSRPAGDESGGSRSHDRVRGGQAAPRGERRGGTDPAAPAHERVRGRADARRDGAGRLGGERRRQDRLHAAAALRRRRRDLAVQLSGPPRRPQGRPCARGGQRGRPEARSADTSDGAPADEDAARGGAAGECDPVRDRAGRRARAARSAPIRACGRSASRARPPSERRSPGSPGSSASRSSSARTALSIVLPDADLERVAAATAAGGYVNAGQVCISVQRVLVARDVYGEFVELLDSRSSRASARDIRSTRAPGSAR